MVVVFVVAVLLGVGVVVAVIGACLAVVPLVVEVEGCTPLLPPRSRSAPFDQAGHHGTVQTLSNDTVLTLSTHHMIPC